MTDTLICVGTILGVHGLKGTLTVYSDTRPASGIAGYSCWHLGMTADAAKAYTVGRCWQHGNKGMLAELEGVTSRAQAEQLKKIKIWVSADEIDVDDDEYLWEELVGCDVYVDNRLIGSVLALEEYGAQDILVVKAPKDAAVQGEWMLPFTEEVIQLVDMQERRVDACLLDGMDACFTPKS
ncbi:MAG: 16S rRNA processing protein RimM [Proteobacteria bacterium]|nr:MAG: 16S rRNA processing protein RimM [Pseudomonadota bacterium]